MSVEVKPTRANKPFAFNAENEAKFQKLLTRYPETAALNLPGLWLIQQQEGWISYEAMEYLAERINIPVTQVYEVATFYTMFNLKPVGKYHFQVCRTLSCELRGGEEILAHLVKRLGIKPGETSKDGRYTLTKVECLGSCGSGPMFQLNDDYHEWLTIEKVDEILAKLP